MGVITTTIVSRIIKAYKDGTTRYFEPYMRQNGSQPIVEDSAVLGRAVLGKMVLGKE